MTEIYNVTLPDLMIEAAVLVERKKMKNCRLKVYPDKTIRLSVPEQTSKIWIQNFLNSKRAWLSKKLDFLEQSKKRPYVDADNIQNGAVFCFLGEELTCSIAQGKKRQAYLEDNVLHICAPDINDQRVLFSLFDQWWKTESLKVLNSAVEKLYPIVGSYKVEKPDIKLRKMKTMWGSCSPHRGMITFNRNLTRAPLACVEYVVLHELIHLIHPNHGKLFYAFLSRCLPDWQECKKALGMYYVR